MRGTARAGLATHNPRDGLQGGHDEAIARCVNGQVVKATGDHAAIQESVALVVSRSMWPRTRLSTAFSHR